MFGSVAFMMRGKLCIGARPDHIMCRIDPALQDVVLKHEGCRNVVMKGRSIKGYVHVDADVVRTKGALQYWIELALNYNERIAATMKDTQDVDGGI